MNKGYLEKFWNGLRLEEEERENVDVGSNNCNEKEGMELNGSTGKNKIKTLGTERNEKFDTMYIQKS